MSTSQLCSNCTDAHKCRTSVGLVCTQAVFLDTSLHDWNRDYMYSTCKRSLSVFWGSDRRITYGATVILQLWGISTVHKYIPINGFKQTYNNLKLSNGNCIFIDSQTKKFQMKLKARKYSVLHFPSLFFPHVVEQIFFSNIPKLTP